MNELIIYGAGGSARETAWLATQDNTGGGRRVAGFIDDDADRQGRLVHGIPVLALDIAVKQHPQASYVVAVGGSGDRERLAGRMEAAGLKPATLVHPRVERSGTVDIGPGTVICAGCILTVDIVIGAHVQVNVACTISHDCVVGDFSTLAPGVHISGWVHLGRRVQLGTGAVITNGKPGQPLTIGDDAVVGAGAVVTGDVAAATTVAGIPARPLGPGAHFNAST
jgi:sugar O-acyltransferase (sialic acid O-acetyltransferase NeuD family)